MKLRRTRLLLMLLVTLVIYAFDQGALAAVGCTKCTGVTYTGTLTVNMERKYYKNDATYHYYYIICTGCKRNVGVSQGYKQKHTGNPCAQCGYKASNTNPTTGTTTAHGKGTNIANYVPGDNGTHTIYYYCLCGNKNCSLYKGATESHLDTNPKDGTCDKCKLPNVFAVGGSTACKHTQMYYCCANGNKCSCGHRDHGKCHTHTFAYKQVDKTDHEVSCKDSSCGYGKVKMKHTDAIQLECNKCGKNSICSACEYKSCSCQTHTCTYQRCCSLGLKCSGCLNKTHEGACHTHSYTKDCCNNGKKCSCEAKDHSICHTHNYASTLTGCQGYLKCSCGETTGRHYYNKACSKCGTTNVVCSYSSNVKGQGCSSVKSHTCKTSVTTPATNHNCADNIDVATLKIVQKGTNHIKTWKCTYCGNSNSKDEAHTFTVDCCFNGKRCICGYKNHTCATSNNPVKSQETYTVTLSYIIPVGDLPKSISVVKGQSITLPTPTPVVHQDYKFGYWYNNSSEKEQHSGGEKYTVNGNVTFNAKWITCGHQDQWKCTDKGINHTITCPVTGCIGIITSEHVYEYSASNNKGTNCDLCGTPEVQCLYCKHRKEHKCISPTTAVSNTYEYGKSHTCIKCNTEPIINGAPVSYCVNCKRRYLCSVEKCYKERTEKRSDSAYTRTSKYCIDHKCLEEYCDNQKADGADYCTAHIKSGNGCRYEIKNVGYCGLKVESNSSDRESYCQYHHGNKCIHGKYIDEKYVPIDARNHKMVSRVCALCREKFSATGREEPHVGSNGVCKYCGYEKANTMAVTSNATINSLSNSLSITSGAMKVNGDLKTNKNGISALK